jgi:hypothetical protein
MVMMISTYNPDTPGDFERAQKEARENPVIGGSRVMTDEELAALNNKANSGYGGVLGKVQDVIEPVAKPIVQNIPKVDTNTLIAAAAAYFLPGLGASLGAELFAAQIAAGTMTAATATAIGTAIASTAVQTSQGVDFETALQNATVNAVVSTGSPEVAKNIVDIVGSPGVTNAITSAGASIVSTMAKGGSAEDALKNAGAAIAASGVSEFTNRTVGAAVGGAITGGTTGAALGVVGELGRPSPVTKAPEPEPTPVAETPAPEPTPVAEVPAPEPIPVAEAPEPLPVDPVQLFNESIAQGIIPVNVAQDIQVAAADGSIPPDQTKLGINQFKNGTYATFQEADGSLRSVPVILDAEGKVYSATGSAADVDFLIKNNVGILRVDPAGLNSAFLDKSPINPQLTPSEVEALKNITSTRVEIAQKYPDLANLLKTYGSLDVAETAIGLDALTKIPGVMQAINAGYVKELEAGLSSDPTYAPYLEEYKKITGRDYSPANPVTDLGTIEIVGEKLKDVTQPYTPSIIVPESSIVVNVDPTTNKALVMDSKGKVSLVDTGGDVKKDQYVTIDPTTNKATASRTYPTVTAGTTGAVAPGSETVFKNQTQAQTPITDIPTPPSGGGGGGGKPSSAPAPSGGFTGGVTDKPTTTSPDRPQEDTKIVEKSDTTGSTDATTGKSKYKPELFIYGGRYPSTLSRSLGTDLQAGGTPTPTTGLTTSRGAGEIGGEGGIERKNVWNEESLRLKDALGL